MTDMRSELCKTCIHTEVCSHDKNLIGDVFLGGGNPVYTDNQKLFEEFLKWKAKGFPCDDYMAEQRWIPCSERLPDGRLNKSYLVQDKDGRRAVGTYTNWGWMFGYYMNDPVAWMPLPDPYEEI